MQARDVGIPDEHELAAAGTVPRTVFGRGLDEWRSAVAPWQLPVAALLGTISVAALGFRPGLLSALYLAAGSAALLATDIRSHRLPNAIVLPGYGVLAAELIWSALLGDGAFFPALACAAVTVALLLAMNAGGGMGMGDVKLGGLLAGCLGLVDVGSAAAALVGSFLLGGVAAAVLLAIDPCARRRSIPFGPFLLAGFWGMLSLLAADAAR